MKHPETDNEKRALVALYKTCLDNIGGTCLADLESDPYTWVGWEDLLTRGWSVAAAKGTFGALYDKGLVAYDSENTHFLPRAAYRLAANFNYEAL